MLFVVKKTYGNGCYRDVVGGEVEEEVEVVVEGGLGSGKENPTGSEIENHIGNGIENPSENEVENPLENGIQNPIGNGIENPIVIVLVTEDFMELLYEVGGRRVMVHVVEQLMVMGLVGHSVHHGILTWQLTVDESRTLMIMGAVRIILQKDHNG